jgi:DNA repair exonuclease SbcCD ATPase subunit
MFEDKDLVETLETPEVEVESPEVGPQETSEIQPHKELNLRQLRKDRERFERERDDALKRLEESERRYAQKNEKQSAEQEDDYNINVGADEFAEGKHLNKVVERINKMEQKLEAKMNAFHKQTQAATVENRIKVEYPDFDRVVSAENVEILKDRAPRLAQSIGDDKNEYNQAVAAYEAIMELGIAQKAPTVNRNVENIKKNMNKPRPASSVSPQNGDSPLTAANSFANGLTDEMKQEIYKRMVNNSAYYDVY